MRDLQPIANDNAVGRFDQLCNIPLVVCPAPEADGMRMGCQKGCGCTLCHVVTIWTDLGG